MLRAILISPRPEQRSGLDALCRQTELLALIETFHEYPQLESLKRFARVHSPHAVFLDMSSEPEPAFALAKEIRQALPAVAVVGVLSEADPRRMMQAMREGAADVLYLPFQEDLFRESVARLEEALRDAPRDAAASELLYSFLPAKAGDGCSVVVSNAAFSLAAMPGAEVLLADLDLSAGTTRFLLKLQNGHCSHDALERIVDLDGMVWSDIVVACGPLQVLGSGEIRPPMDMLASRVRALLGFVRRRYRAVCVDLSGALDEMAIAAIEESRRTFLVMTPELASVYLAREKVRFLRSQGLENKIGVILNRWTKDAPIHMAGIEEVLGLPISYTLPEDRSGVQTAILNGTHVVTGSSLGKEFTKMAFSLSDAKTLTKAAPPPKRMVDYFTLAPGRYNLLR